MAGVTEGRWSGEASKRERVGDRPSVRHKTFDTERKAREWKLRMRLDGWTVDIWSEPSLFGDDRE